MRILLFRFYIYFSKFPKIDIFTFLYFQYLINSKKVSSISLSGPPIKSILSFRYANLNYGYLLFSYYPEKNLLVGQDRGTLVMDGLLRLLEEGNPFVVLFRYWIHLIPVIPIIFFDPVALRVITTTTITHLLSYFKII